MKKVKSSADMSKAVRKAAPRVVAPDPNKKKAVKLVNTVLGGPVEKDDDVIIKFD